MATKQEFADFVTGQMRTTGMLEAKKMFGEYAVYLDGKIVALFCDDKLFVKPTEGGRNFIKKANEASPYPGAKPYFLIEEQLEDSKWLSELIKITYKELPEPKPKKKKVP